MTDDRWDFLPREWPKIETEREYQAVTMVLASFNEAIAKAPEGSPFREAMILSTDGIRFRVREWEREHGVPPAG